MNMDFKSAKELLALCAENTLPISEVMRRRECLLGEVEQDAVDRRMAKAWDIMRASATQPLETPIKSIRSVRRFISFCRMPNCFLVLADTRYCHFCGRMGKSAMLHLTYFSS